VLFSGKGWNGRCTSGVVVIRQTEFATRRFRLTGG